MFGLKNLFGSKGAQRSGAHGEARANQPAAASSGSPRVRVSTRSEFNLLVLIDSSYSVEQEALDYVFSTGLPTMIAKMREKARDNDCVYNLSVATFANEYVEVLPFTNVRDITWDPAQFKVEATGVTCMEAALWEAFARTDRQKADQDAKRIARSGSMVVIATDGCPTDEDGYRTKLSPELVEEVLNRNITRSASTFVIGMGSVDDETLLQLGPSTRETVEGGQSVDAARAVRYVGGDYQDKQCWNAVCSLIGKASSSSSEDVFMVDASTAASLPNIDSVFVPDAGFAVVR